MEQLYDVRIVEKYGRERVLAELRRVTKQEGLRMIGALLLTHPSGGSNTWVQPRVAIRRVGTTEWHEQDLTKTPRRAAQVLEAWLDFINYRRGEANG